MPDEFLTELLEEFLLEGGERVDRLEDALLGLDEAGPDRRRELLTAARHELHTLKGNSGMMGLDDLQALAHVLEDRLEAAERGPLEVDPLLAGLDRFRARLAKLGAADARRQPGSSAGRSRPAGSVRVPSAELDSLVDLVAELVISRNGLAEAVARASAVDREEHADRAVPGWAQVEAAREGLDKTLDLLQERILALRKVPLRTLFGPLKRIAHDEASRSGKEVRFTALGGETPLDKALSELASDALGHLVRNAVIHGIEGPDARQAAGKPRQGNVTLRAAVHAGEVHIEVEDDGGGIDRQALLQAAAQRGLEEAGGEDLHALVFLAGVSTRERADLSAGRGMGMSAVLAAVQRHGGWIEVASERGEGARFLLRLPLSISITRALLVRSDAEEYALPVSAVVETVPLAPAEAHRLNDAGVIRWRGTVLPLLDIGHALGTRSRLGDRGYVVVFEAEGRRRGLLVDDLGELREIVVKSLDALLGRPRGVSGSTILGDGRVIMILDPPALAALPPFERRSTSVLR